MSQENFLVTIDSDTEWTYDTTNIFGGSLSVEFDSTTHYTLTIVDSDANSTTETHTTTSAVTTVELTVKNESSAGQTVEIGNSRASVSVPLADGATIVIVSALGSIGSTPTLSCSLTDIDDPTFTLKPAKPPPTNVSHQTATSAISWDGSAWSPSAAVGNSGGTLTIENATEASVTLVLANDTTVADRSTITFDVPAREELGVSFGSGYLLEDGAISVGTVSASLVVTPAS